ncbi:hypothetical protein SAMN05443432_104332 [Roseovarius litoreus]|uniref:Uncharacterized protein n=1 Tax=Roseovarius litoreus TaxID=1155722 RepID=A0A1M7FU80_9RHOB|nr:hypothetical protein SAMN05443432_104332 [Roseovarius litoreus]
MPDQSAHLEGVLISRTHPPVANDRCLRREYFGNDESAGASALGSGPRRAFGPGVRPDVEMPLSSFEKYSAGVWGCKTPTAPTAKGKTA